MRTYLLIAVLCCVSVTAALVHAAPPGAAFLGADVFLQLRYGEKHNPITRSSPDFSRGKVDGLARRDVFYTGPKDKNLHIPGMVVRLQTLAAPDYYWVPAMTASIAARLLSERSPYGPKTWNGSSISGSSPPRSAAHVEHQVRTFYPRKPRQKVPPASSSTPKRRPRR